MSRSRNYFALASGFTEALASGATEALASFTEALALASGATEAEALETLISTDAEAWDAEAEAEVWASFLQENIATLATTANNKTNFFIFVIFKKIIKQ